MAKNRKSTKNLTDDWIKQVVTGQRRKLAHMADGGEVPEYMRGLNDEQLRAIGVERSAPEAPAASAPEAPLAIDTIPGDPGSTVDQLRSNWKKIDEASGYKDGGAVTEALPVLSLEEVLKGSGGIVMPERKVEPVQLPAPPKYNAEQEGKQTKTVGAYKNGGCVKRMEKGGEVDGPGTGTSDSVPAMLSDGEYVLPADTVAAVGKATLDKLKAATHTPVNKPAMRGMVPHLADGGGQKFTDQQWALARQFYPNTNNPAQSIENVRRENPIALQQASGRLEMPQTPLQKAGPLQFLNPLRVVSDTSPAPAAPAPLPAAPTPEPAPAAPAPSPAAPSPAAAKPAINPNFMPTMTGPNTAQDMLSEGRTLMNTQGIGGFVQAKGLNRMAQTVNQANAPLISGQYGLQEAALTANERLERAKLDEHQRQQNLETWTPDKNMMGELVGYGRTKGGRPEYVTKESLMSRPTLAQFLAKARPVNPKATDEQLTAHYNATYAEQ